MRILLIIFSILVVATTAHTKSLPKHKVTKSSLAPKTGMRVEILGSGKFTRNECKKLIEQYRKLGEPDGQVVVVRLADKGVLKGKALPWCLDNFDGSGVIFNAHFEGSFTK